MNVKDARGACRIMLSRDRCSLPTPIWNQRARIYALVLLKITITVKTILSVDIIFFTKVKGKDGKYKRVDTSSQGCRR